MNHESLTEAAKALARAADELRDVESALLVLAHEHSRNSANPADIDRKEGDACPVTGEQARSIVRAWYQAVDGNGREDVWKVLQPMIAKWGYVRTVDAGRFPPRKIDVDDAKPAPGPVVVDYGMVCFILPPP